MKRLAAISIMLVIMFSTLILSGCSGGSGTSSSKGTASPQSGGSGGEVESPAAEGSSEEGPPAGEDNQKVNGEGKIVEPDPNSEEVECDWYIKIDDETKTQVGPVNFDVRLQFSGEKKGGKDPRGTWGGKAVILLKGDPRSIDSGIVAGSLDGIGKDENVSFELGDDNEPVPLVSPSPAPIPVVPLVERDYYEASDDLHLTAATTTDILFSDSSGQFNFNDAKSFTGTRKFYIKVHNLTATMVIEGIGTFEGTCEGIPVTPVK